MKAIEFTNKLNGAIKDFFTVATTSDENANVNQMQDIELSLTGRIQLSLKIGEETTHTQELNEDVKVLRPRNRDLTKTYARPVANLIHEMERRVYQEVQKRDGVIEGKLNYFDYKVLIADDDNSTLWIKWGNRDCPFRDLSSNAMATVADTILFDVPFVEEQWNEE